MAAKDFNKIEHSLVSILDLLRDVVTASERQEVIDFVDVGEYGVALETLGGLLVEERKSFPAVALDAMADLADVMGIRESVITPELERGATRR